MNTSSSHFYTEPNNKPVSSSEVLPSPDCEYDDDYFTGSPGGVDSHLVLLGPGGGPHLISDIPQREQSLMDEILSRPMLCSQCGGQMGDYDDSNTTGQVTESDDKAYESKETQSTNMEEDTNDEEEATKYTDTNQYLEETTGMEDGGDDKQEGMYKVLNEHDFSTSAICPVCSRERYPVFISMPSVYDPSSPTLYSTTLLIFITGDQGQSSESQRFVPQEFKILPTVSKNSLCTQTEFEFGNCSTESQSVVSQGPEVLLSARNVTFGTQTELDLYEFQRTTLGTQTEIDFSDLFNGSQTLAPLKSEAASHVNKASLGTQTDVDFLSLSNAPQGLPLVEKNSIDTQTELDYFSSSKATQIFVSQEPEGALAVSKHSLGTQTNFDSFPSKHEKVCRQLNVIEKEVLTSDHLVISDETDAETFDHVPEEMADRVSFTDFLEEHLSEITCDSRTFSDNEDTAVNQGNNIFHNITEKDGSLAEVKETKNLMNLNRIREGKPDDSKSLPENVHINHENNGNNKLEELVKNEAKDAKKKVKFDVKNTIKEDVITEPVDGEINNKKMNTRVEIWEKADNERSERNTDVSTVKLPSSEERNSENTQVNASSSEDLWGIGTAPRMFKVVFLGDCSVGKTSFIHRASTGVFGKSFSSTVGVDLKTVSVDVGRTRVALQLWDTAGQERYRSLTKQYYRKADAVVVIYDVTNLQSFQHVLDWVGAVKEDTGEIVVVVIGNKKDAGHLRVVACDTAHTFAKNHEFHLYEASAVTGEGVVESLKHLAGLLLMQQDHNIETSSVLTLHGKENTKKNKCC
ncbi:uncharacterized protein LOC143035566 [Oratosquilla oratoria]|uniref:uncharacterized protein LOC143035566 n=1 Tax=Oratosquilla oratoria TaxID=337810 RepID=UPI003F7743BD